MIKPLILTLSLIFSASAFALDDGITSAKIIAEQELHTLDYSHFKIIGVCEWLHIGMITRIETTAEIDEYKPDLVVTVYNQVGEDPWVEADLLIDPVASGLGSQFLGMITGDSIDTGNESETTGMHYQMLREKIVDVIGDPLTSAVPLLRSDTKPMFPYYQSNLDVLNRLGVAELIRPETYEIAQHVIGDNMMEHWSYEFPRTMNVDVDNDYKAAVVAAQHAADIVTNQNQLHIVKSVQDSCGTNCAVSNVIEEQSDQNEIWQEVYPNDEHVAVGQDDALSVTSTGSSDDIKGNGNYVFVVWRHYRGCEQNPNLFMNATVRVPPTQKR